MQPFGNHVTIRVGAATPQNAIAQGIVQDLGTWIKGAYDLLPGDEVQFRLIISPPPKAADIIYVRLEDIFAIVTAAERPPFVPGPGIMGSPPELPPSAEPSAGPSAQAKTYPVGVKSLE